MILEPKIYGISSYSSNSMKSDNPDSGIYEAKTSRTLDLNGGNPACNQGGMIVLEGNGTRPSHHGDGYLESDKMYTLNTIERHAVCYWDGGQTAGTLTANNAGGSQRMPDKNHFQCVIETHSIGNGQVHDAMSPSKEVCKTLNCMDDPMKVVIAIDRAAFNQGENAKYDFQISGGGYSANHCCKRPRSCLLQKTIGSLCATDYKFPQQQQIDQEKYVIEIYERQDIKNAIKELNQIAPHQQDLLQYEDDVARTLAASTHGAAKHLTKTIVRNRDMNDKQEYIVRRLTPLECNRLQGFPDFWGGDRSEGRLYR